MLYTLKNVLVAWALIGLALFVVWLETVARGSPPWLFRATAVGVVAAGVVGTFLGLWLRRHIDQGSKK